MRRNLTCIVCPRGCSLEVEIEEGKVISVTGQSCKRGVAYAETECTHPTRTLTTTMALEGGGVLAVRTDKPVPKELVFDCMKEINAMTAPRGTRIGTVLIADILGTGANVIASQNADE